MSEKADYENSIPNEIFRYRRSPRRYAIKMASHAGVGLALGIAVDKVCKRVQNAYNLRSGLMIIIQLTVLATIFYILEIYTRKGRKYFLEAQNISPGLFFAGLMFGSQFNLFENIKKFVEPL